MNSPSVDIKTILDGESLGVDVYTFKEPPGTPNECITVYDTGGFPADEDYTLERPTVQVKVRGEMNQARETFTIAQDVKEVLHKKANETVGSTRYIGIWCMGGIIWLGLDDSNRPMYSINFRMERTE